MVEIHPSAVVDKKAELGDGVYVGPHCVVEAGCVIGEGTVLEANVVVSSDVKLGKNNRLYPCCVLGRSPQLLGFKTGTKVGRLEIGDNNALRENVTMHPGMYPDAVTKLGSDNLIMVGSHIGHDCIVGNKIVMSNGCQVSGHVHIEDGVWISGMVGIHQFCTIGKWAYVAGFSAIAHDIPPFVIVSGHYPPMIRSVNKRGLIRAGLSEESKAAVTDAFRKLYRSGGTLLENATHIYEQDGIDENVKAMTQMIINSSKQRFGRYLEGFRHR